MNTNATIHSATKEGDPSTTTAVPPLFAPTAAAARRFVEFFSANVRSPSTRRSYAWAATAFSDWCKARGLDELQDVTPAHVAAYIEELLARLSQPSVQVQLAAIRKLFDWLVAGQVVAANPADGVHGPKRPAGEHKTPVLSADEARALLDSIDTSTEIGLRDRALISLMVYSFARISAALTMRGQDVYALGRSTWVHLQEPGGRQHEMPCHHTLDAYLHAYIDAVGIAADGQGWLFRSAIHGATRLSERPMSQADAYRMIRRRALSAGIQARVGNYSFRATGIADYLRNGGQLGIARKMVELHSPRADRELIQEVERIAI